MRFDDRLDTVLKIDPEHASGRAAIWRQLIDMLAHSGALMTATSAARCLRVLALLRDQIPLHDRIDSINAIGGRVNYAPLVAFLAHDHPHVAIAATDKARLSDADWLAIVPDMGPVGRSRLRQRGDVGQAVKSALALYGTADFALPSRVAAPAESAESTESGVSTTDFAALVRRIDTYRTRKAQGEDDRGRVAIRCDIEGQIRAVKGASRARFIGISIAEPARPTETGCDAGVARAFGKRSPIRAGRLCLALDATATSDADGVIDTLWQIDADPQFAADNGRFLGYAGHVQPLPRGQADAGAGPEKAAGAEQAGEASAPTPMADSMRQLVHELRSPLNAISGFAQLITGQYFGPVGQTYRRLAEQILSDSAHLTNAFEDIEIAALLDSGRMAVVTGRSDLRESVSRICPLVARPALSGDEAVVAVDARELDRIVRKFFEAIALSTPSGTQRMLTSETVVIERTDSGTALLRAARVARIGQVVPSAESGVIAQDAQQMLGPDFTLRLVDQMAQLYGGNLTVEENQYILNLPLLNHAMNRVDAAG
ncbi:MAG: histidine kinase dimerization/phospho-acceptor domain-containing protein [Sphingopyxis sp.]